LTNIFSLTAISGHFSRKFGMELSKKVQFENTLIEKSRY